jgi:hypothetical protein
VRRILVLAVLIIGATFVGAGGASASTLLHYGFETGTPGNPGCNPVPGTSPASFSSEAVVGGPFGQTFGGCNIGWQGPGAFTLNGFDASVTWDFFTFKVVKPIRVDSIVVNGWENPFSWPGPAGFSFDIGPKDGPVPGYRNPTSAWTRFGVLPAPTWGGRIYADQIVTGPGVLQPGRYAIRITSLSVPDPWTTQLWLSGVTLNGEVDVTPPTITASATTADGAPYSAGVWTNKPVTVHYTCVDEVGGSGIPAGACPADQKVSTETPLAGVDLSASVADAAGNRATSAPFTVKLDLTAPTVTFSGNAGTYTVADTITITCAAGDLLSGVASDACASSGLPGVPAATLTLGTHTLNASVTDKAGNTGSGVTTFTVTATAESVAVLTTRYIQSSPNYQNLTASQKKVVDALAAVATRAVARIVPTLNSGQKHGLLVAYNAALNTLVRTGWLTPSQATTLSGFAAAL